MRPVFVLQLVLVWTILMVDGSTGINKVQLKEQVLEMFRHAYWSYMKYAYPADELMPLSCKGRFRGVTPSRGDVDDSLGNFSLTLVDTLDTLMLLGEFAEFERAVSLVINNVQFDSDIVVSVFETNIRVVGGLLSGHLMAKALQAKDPLRMPWYKDQLLLLAKDVATRLLPAFNSTSGLPYPRINLKRGMTEALRKGSDTCTACGGTMILEFAALSRLTGDGVFEEKAHKAMDFLWTQRHRGSDLMGTVLNIHNGDWIRRDSGIGAGIDSYYEYCLKAYILLGDEAYLYRFNKHYDAVMKYVSQGPMFVDVHMHKPTIASRSFMDSLLAFWPGLQAFTHDFQVHWGQHPLRPEFVESTYFLYKATHDPHYLEVGQNIIEGMNKHVRVPCGFAGIKDVRTMTHEDRMDSFVLAETFKYLYMLFAEPDELPIDPENYIFTTEAHFLPLSLAMSPTKDSLPPGMLYRSSEDRTSEPRSCVNTKLVFRGELSSYGRLLRSRMKGMVGRGSAKGEHCQRDDSGGPRLEASAFSAGNPEHLSQLKRMGISIQAEGDGRVQLVHSANSAASAKDAEDGLLFMQEMIELSRKQEQEVPHPARVVQVMTVPYLGIPSFVASPAQFGVDLTQSLYGVEGRVVVGHPMRACSALLNVEEVRGKVVIVERSDCMFVEKTQHAENAGAIGVIVIDHFQDSESEKSPLFAMSGDGKTSVGIPAVFLFRKEGEELLRLMGLNPLLTLRLGQKALNPRLVSLNMLRNPTKSSNNQEMCEKKEESVGKERIGRPRQVVEIYLTPSGQKQLTFNFHLHLDFQDKDLNAEEKASQVEALIDELYEDTNLAELEKATEFVSVVRKMAYMAMGDPIQMTIQEEKLLEELALSLETGTIIVTDDEHIPKPSYTALKETPEKPKENEDEEELIEVYQTDDIICALRKKEGKIDCHRTKKTVDGESIHTEQKSAESTDSPNDAQDKVQIETAQEESYSEDGVKCFYEDDGNTVRCEPDKNSKSTQIRFSSNSNSESNKSPDSDDESGLESESDQSAQNP